MNPYPKIVVHFPRFWKGLEFALLLCSLLLFVYYASIQCEVYVSRKSSNIYASLGHASGDVHAAESDRKGVHDIGSDVIGRVSIPQLGLSAPITNDINRIELIRGVGHIPGTAFAGGLGTMGLAGHRDTFFRALRQVKPGMRILVESGSGRYQYDVESVRVVEPSEVAVLEIQTKPKLVLVTCYPFAFVGAAPQRYIVTAVLRSVSGEAP